jgi:hypothetical protein
VRAPLATPRVLLGQGTVVGKGAAQMSEGRRVSMYAEGAGGLGGGTVGGVGGVGDVGVRVGGGGSLSPGHGGAVQGGGVANPSEAHPRGGMGWNGEHADKLRGMCGTGRKGTMFVQELIYPREQYLGISSSNSPIHLNTMRYLLSLNNPMDDAVVSKGILEWLFSPPGTYPPSTEVHALCTALPETQEVGGGGGRGRCPTCRRETKDLPVSLTKAVVKDATAPAKL